MKGIWRLLRAVGDVVSSGADMRIRGIAALLAVLCVATVSSSTVVNSSGVAVIDLPADVGGLQPAAHTGERVQLLPIPPRPRLCAPGSLVRGVDVGSQKVIAFSFDDGPWPSNTQNIMSTFESHGLHATFFMIGNNVRNYPDIARDVVARGFEVANHSMTHQYSPSTIASEIGPTNDLIGRITGVKPELFRSPGLTEGRVIQDTLRSVGMCNIFDTIDLRDWVTPRRTSSELCSSFKATMHPGEIVLLHDGGSHRQTVDTVPCMLDAAIARGYQVVTVGELLLMGYPYERAPALRTQGVEQGELQLTE